MPMHTVCRSDEVAVGQMKSLVAGKHKIVLYHLSDGWFATQASCTHLFAPLARGKIIADRNVQCPFHRACFDIRTGKVVSWANFPPGIQILNLMRAEKSLRCFPVNIVGDHIEVDIPAN